MDLSNSEKNGILLIKDDLEREWVPHFFVLTKTKMSYTEMHQEENELEENDGDDPETTQLRLREVGFNTHSYHLMLPGNKNDSF